MAGQTHASPDLVRNAYIHVRKAQMAQQDRHDFNVTPCLRQNVP